MCVSICMFCGVTVKKNSSYVKNRFCSTRCANLFKAGMQLVEGTVHCENGHFFDFSNSGHFCEKCGRSPRIKNPRYPKETRGHYSVAHYLANMRWAQKNRLHINEMTSRRRKLDAANGIVRDGYIAVLLGLTVAQIPNEIIEVKRLTIQLGRRMKNVEK